MHRHLDVLLTKTSLAPSECDTGIHVLLTKLASRERDHKNVRRRPGLSSRSRRGRRGARIVGDPYEQPSRPVRAVTERLVLSEICLKAD